MLTFGETKLSASGSCVLFSTSQIILNKKGYNTFYVWMILYEKTLKDTDQDWGVA
jgi:hypothetical protein